MAENKNNPESTGSTHSSAQQLLRNIGDLFDLHQGDTYTIKGGAEDDGTPVFGEQLLLYSTTPEGERIRLLLSRDPEPGEQERSIKIEFKDLEYLSRKNGYNVVSRYVVALKNGELEETNGHYDVNKKKKIYKSDKMSNNEVNALNTLLITSKVATKDEIEAFLWLDDNVEITDFKHWYSIAEVEKNSSKKASGKTGQRQLAQGVFRLIRWKQ